MRWTLGSELGSITREVRRQVMHWGLAKKVGRANGGGGYGRLVMVVMVPGAVPEGVTGRGY